ncbi:ATP-binding protein, partial [bacterium]
METKEKIKKILFEWKESDLPIIYERDFDLSLLETSEIITLMGPRRAGKTYLCYQMIKKLRIKVPHDNILYINFEDERLYPLNGDELTLLLDVCFEVFSVNTKHKIYIFLDEIQNIPNWAKWTRRVSDQNKNIKLVLTGSSSKLLSKEIATELRGRTLSFSVYPLSFSEYLRAKKIKVQKKDILYSKERILVKKEFNKFFKMGGFPA